MTNVPMIRNMEIENWNTTSVLRSHPPFTPAESWPFKTLIGLKPDKNKAGYEPARHPTIKIRPINTGASHLMIVAETTNSFPESSLNKGNSARATITAIIAATKVIITDSVKN